MDAVIAKLSTGALAELLAASEAVERERDALPAAIEVEPVEVTSEPTPAPADDVGL